MSRSSIQSVTFIRTTDVTSLRRALFLLSACATESASLHRCLLVSLPEDDDNDARDQTSLLAVSANTLARYLGVTPKVIYDLAKAGVIQRAPGRLFPLQDSVRRYCDYLRGQVNKSSVQ
jgi:hypothetical protein